MAPGKRFWSSSTSGLVHGSGLMTGLGAGFGGAAGFGGPSAAAGGFAAGGAVLPGGGGPPGAAPAGGAEGFSAARDSSVAAGFSFAPCASGGALGSSAIQCAACMRRRFWNRSLALRAPCLTHGAGNFNRRGARWAQPMAVPRVCCCGRQWLTAETPCPPHHLESTIG